ncbi:MAG: ABC transporter ATP-binding protein [Lachnospiraceae bacterium]|nr:ABC transporter ATP-binding protein [Lachnospiraceae bacterium]
MGQIDVHGLTKAYRNSKGVFSLDFSVKKGEVFGYLGPNGAGKTTTIRQLMGFIRPDSGTVRIEGMDCFERRQEIQLKLGYLPGEIALMDNMTGIGYLHFMADMKQIHDRRRMEELIARFELDAKGPIRKMSKGTKQKLGIICAFMQNPEILILDEPTSGLDPLMQNRFIELILEEKKKGTTIFMSSHIFEEVEKTCDRTAIIRAGKLVTIEDMNSLAQKKNKIYTVTFADEEAAKHFAANRALPVKNVTGNRVQLAVTGQPGEILKQIAAVNPLDMDIKIQSLEELFLHFYNEEEA